MLIKSQQIKVKMYQEPNHQLPHVHIDYGSSHHTASYGIDPPTRLKGSLERKYDKAVLGWITTNAPKLLEDWNNLQGGAQPQNEYVLGELSGT